MQRIATDPPVRGRGRPRKAVKPETTPMRPKSCRSCVLKNEEQAKEGSEKKKNENFGAGVSRAKSFRISMMKTDGEATAKKKTSAGSSRKSEVVKEIPARAKTRVSTKEGSTKEKSKNVGAGVSRAKTCKATMVKKDDEATAKKKTSAGSSKKSEVVKEASTLRGQPKHQRAKTVATGPQKSKETKNTISARAKSLGCTKEENENVGAGTPKEVVEKKKAKEVPRIVSRRVTFGGTSILRGRPKRGTAKSAGSILVKKEHFEDATPKTRRAGSLRASLPRSAKTAALKKPQEAKKMTLKEPKTEDGDRSSSSSSEDDSSDSDEDLGYAAMLPDIEDYVAPAPRKKRGRPRKSSPSQGPKISRSTSPRRHTPKRQISVDERQMEVLLGECSANCNEEASLKATSFTELTPTRVILQRWAIVDRLEPLLRDSPSNRYLVMDVDGGLMEDGEMRIYPVSQMHRLVFENTFLDRMEKIQRSHMVLLPLEHNIVLGKDGVKFCYIVTAARSGPRIDEMFQFHNGILSDRDASRIATGMLEVVEQLIKLGYMLLDVDPNSFALDDQSQKVYLRNCRNVGIGYEHHGFLKNFERNDSLRWRGIEKYAPLAAVHDPNTPMTECDCLEALFYVILDLTGRFQLAASRETMMDAKERWHKADENELRNEMPSVLASFWLTICRGRKFVYNRTDTLQNGYILYSEAREHQRRKGAIPTAAYVDYDLLYKCLKTLGDLENAVMKPWDFCFEEPKMAEFALTGALNQFKLEKEGLEADIDVLNKTKKHRELDERQLERERLRNERFLNKYLDLTKTEKLELDKEFEQAGMD